MSLIYKKKILVLYIKFFFEIDVIQDVTFNVEAWHSNTIILIICTCVTLMSTFYFRFCSYDPQCYLVRDFPWNQRYQPVGHRSLTFCCATLHTVVFLGKILKLSFYYLRVSCFQSTKAAIAASILHFEWLFNPFNVVCWCKIF